ncbi:MAG: bacillithiol biosynthesis cysteine-adding enzyme BshC [Acidobacteria bacterium]|nr:bacillithiol biosynthesis cysteine-adding enzyme BshC [Acidobacteriota bacterium]
MTGLRMDISYARVPNSTPLLLDYLYHFERVAEFYTAPPFKLSSYQDFAGKLSSLTISRQALADILIRQNREFDGSPQVFENIDRLKKVGTFAVVTGQQIGLFSGPAFTLYKALTAVRLAQWLSENGLPSVPVFWLATEDHDLDEVSKAAVLDEDYGLVAVSSPGDRPAAHSPVGMVKLTPAITETLGLLESSLPAGGPRDEVLRDLRDTYQPDATWSQAFAKFMARLFGRWGVILVDSCDKELHQLSARAYTRALDEPDALRRRLLDRSAKLTQSGYHSQVFVADDSTLLFQIRDGARQSLHHRNGYFRGGDQDGISVADLMSRFETDPLTLSGNVLLRPVIQDTLLPTLAYVAGPSELAYLGQAQSIYEAFGRPMPVVFPRAAFTLVDARSQRILDKYQISVEDVWQGEEPLGRKIAAAGFSVGWDQRFDAAGQDITRIFAALAKDIETLDPTLLDPLKNTGEKMVQQLEKLRAKLSRAALQRSDLLTKHQRALLHFFYPGQELQERQVSGIYFLARAGYGLLDRILGAIQVDSSDHQILQY